MGCQVFNHTTISDKRIEQCVLDISGDYSIDFVLIVSKYEMDGIAITGVSKPIILVRCKSLTQFKSVFAHEFKHLLDHKAGFASEESANTAMDLQDKKDGRIKTLIIKH